MRMPFTALLLAVLPTAAFAQSYPSYNSPAAPSAVLPAPTLLAPAQLDPLAAPVALYADPLLAQVLTASTTPYDLIAANQYLRIFPTPTEDMIAAQTWSPAVKALAHYPVVVAQLTDRIALTQQLGAAYATQPADVMNSIQRLRAQAQLAGTLYSTADQQVLLENGIIRILPAAPQVVTVPTYDPRVIYVPASRPPTYVRYVEPRPSPVFNLEFSWSTRTIRPCPPPVVIAHPVPRYDPYDHMSDHRWDRYDRRDDHRNDRWDDHHDDRRDPHDRH